MAQIRVAIIDDHTLVANAPDLAEQIEEAVDNACNDNEWSTQGYEECLSRVDRAVADVFRILCPETGNSPECLAETTDRVMPILDDAYRTGYELVCGRVSQNECIDNYSSFVTDLVDGTVVTIFRTVCPQTGRSPECLAEVSNRILATIGDICNDNSSGTTGVNECAPMVIETGESVANMACNDDHSGTVGTTECINMVLDALDDILLLACGSSSQGDCIENVTRKVTTTIDSACNDDGSGTTGANECAPMVLEAMEDVLDIACDDDYPGTSGDTECINMALNLIETIQNTVCNSASPDTCLTNLLDKLDGDLGGICSSALMGGDPSQNEAAVALLPEASSCATLAVLAARELLCPDTPDADECVNAYTDRILSLVDDGIEAHCPNRECTEPIKDQLLALLEDSILTLCSPGGNCAQEYRDAIDVLLKSAIKTGDELLVGLATELYNMVVLGYDPVDDVRDALTAEGIIDNPVQLTIVGPDGTPLEGAAVAVYLEPFDPPCSWTPPLLSRSNTGADGTVTFNAIHALATSEMPSDLMPDVTSEGVINAKVVAVDAGRTMTTMWNSVIPLAEPHEETVRLSTSLNGDPRAAWSVDELLHLEQVEVLNADDGTPDPEGGPAAGEPELNPSVVPPQTPSSTDGCFAGSPAAVGGGMGVPGTAPLPGSDTGGGSGASGSDAEGDSSGDCWEKCEVKREIRRLKVAQLHSDIGIRSTFVFGRAETHSRASHRRSARAPGRSAGLRQRRNPERSSEASNNPATGMKQSGLRTYGRSSSTHSVMRAAPSSIYTNGITSDGSTRSRSNTAALSRRFPTSARTGTTR